MSSRSRTSEWDEVRSIVEQALDLPEDERVQFVADKCAGRPKIKTTVCTLLECDTFTDQFLEAPVGMGASRARQAVPFDESLIGRGLGKFRLTELLGAGGMGVVYKAVRADDLYDQQVAIKLIRFDADSLEARRRFTNERATLARLEHPHISRLLDGGTTDEGTPYVVMEYIVGEPIDVYCERCRMSIDDRLKLFERVCDAVQYAHQNLVVHRDLKPGNILVTSDGTPKLLDFGLSKLLGNGIPGTDQNGQTSAMIPAMTLRYASPELIRGEKATTAADVYSLGVLLYELLTGRPPFSLDGASSFELARAICEDDPLPMKTAFGHHNASASVKNTYTPDGDSGTPHRNDRIPRTLHDDLQRIVTKAMRKHPGERYVSVEQLAQDLRRFRTGHPVSARRDTLRYRASKFVRRNRWPVAASTCFVVLLIAGTVVSSMALRRVTAEKERADEETRKARIVNEFLTETFAVLDPSATSPDELTARQLLDDAATRLAVLEENDLVRATLGHTIGQAYFRLGALSEAAQLLQSAQEWLSGVAEPDHDLAIKVAIDLAEVNRENGDMQVSADLLNDALRTARIHFGERSLQVGFALHGLGATSISMSHYAEARDHLEAALDILQSNPDADQGDVGKTMSSLGVAHRNLGHHDRAESLFRNSVDVLRSRFGENHADVATSMSNLGNFLRARGRLKEAQEVLTRAIEIQRRLYHHEHIDLATSLNNLGLTLLFQGKLTEAEPFLRESMQMIRVVLGEQSAYLAISLSNFSSMLREQSRYDEAEPLIREAIAIRRVLSGDDDPELAAMQRNLAQLLILMRRPKDAIPPIESALAFYEKSDGRHALSMAMAKSLLAQVQHQLKRYTSAVELYEKAIEEFRAAGEANNSNVGSILFFKAQTLCATGNFLRARNVLNESERISRDILPDDHLHLARTRSLLGIVLVELDLAQEAIPLLERALAVQRAKAKSAFEIALTENRLAAAIAANGRFLDAEPLMASSLMTMREERGDENEFVQRSLVRAIRLYRLLSRVDKARELEIVISTYEPDVAYH